MKCESCANLKAELYCHIQECNDGGNWIQGKIKTLNAYQEATGRTDNHESQVQALINFGLGIGGEAGEVQDVIKKHLYHGHLLDKERISGELGDVLWYIARIAKWADLTLEEVAQTNIDKLKRRYPTGFSQEKSINRIDSHD